VVGGKESDEVAEKRVMRLRKREWWGCEVYVESCILLLTHTCIILLTYCEVYRWVLFGFDPCMHMCHMCIGLTLVCMCVCTTNTHTHTHTHTHTPTASRAGRNRCRRRWSLPFFFQFFFNFLILIFLFFATDSLPFTSAQLLPEPAETGVEYACLCFFCSF
jgi:hypothetical protein